MVLLLSLILLQAIGPVGRSLASETKQGEATSQARLIPDSAPLDIKALAPGHAPNSVITQETVSQTGLTMPSLWWVRDQFAAQEQFGGKLLENWLAYPHNGSKPGRIDFVVNRQLWSLLNYLERYSFVYVFGTVARGDGYNIRVFDQQANFLAAYTCDFSSINISHQSPVQPPSSENPSTVTQAALSSAQSTDTIACDIALDATGRSGLSGRSNLFDGDSSK